MLWQFNAGVWWQLCRSGPLKTSSFPPVSLDKYPTGYVKKFTYPKSVIPMVYHTTALEMDIKSLLNMALTFLRGDFPFLACFPRMRHFVKSPLHLSGKPKQKNILSIQNVPGNQKWDSEWHISKRRYLNLKKIHQCWEGFTTLTTKLDDIFFITWWIKFGQTFE